MRPEYEMSNDAAMLRAQHLERKVEELGYVLQKFNSTTTTFALNNLIL